MKYCPYCGASLPGGAASFCSECGKPLGKRDEKAKKKTPKKRNPSPQPAKRMKPAPTPSTAARRSVDDGYDGYYNDVKPIDSEQMREQTDPELIKRILILLLSAASIIVIAIILMSVL